MADLTAEQAIEKLRNLPEDKQKAVLLKLSPDQRKGILDQLQTPRTAGEKYMQKRRSGQLPTYEAPRTLQEGLAQTAAELSQSAQEYANKAQPIQVKEGKVQGTQLPSGEFQYKTKPFLEQMGRGAQSMLYEAGAEAATIAGGLTDPKTLAVFVLSKLSPVTALGAALYFGYQNSQQLAESIRSGKISPENMRNALNALAGMVGSGAMAGERTPATIKQRLAGMRETAQRFGRQVAGPEAALHKTVSAEAEAYQEAVPENEARLREVIKENQDKLQASRFREGEEKFSLEKTNKEIEAENLRKTQEREAAVKQRQESQVKLEDQSKQAKEKIETVENAVWQEANRKFDAVKTKIGADQPGEPTESATPLTEAVNIAQNNILRGIPESIPLFRQILKLDEETGAMGDLRQQVMQGQGMTGRYADLTPERRAIVDDIAKRYGGEVPETQPVTWSKLQRIKTSAETALRSRATQPIIKEALSGVRDTVVDMMGRMAESKGATAEWQEANNFWRQWKEDFHKRTGPQGSASPIAQSMDAVDSRNISQSLLRTEEASGKNRAVDTLRKYAQYGGNEAADLVQQMSETKKGIGKEPTQVKLKATKPIPERPESKPSLKTLPEKVPQPVVEEAKVTRKALEEKARSLGMNGRDIGIIFSSILVGPIVKFLGGGEVAQNASALLPYGAAAYEGGKYAVSRALRNPQVLKWLTGAPPEELAALNRIPGADKVKIINGITESAVETLQQMNFGPDNTAFARAKTKLGEGASLSDISKEAARMNAEEIRNRQARFDQAKNGGKAVNLSPEVRAFLGPQNVARILAAASGQRKEQGKGPVQTPGQAKERLQVAP